MADHTDTVKEMYAAFASRNTTGIIEKLDPNVDWEFEAPAEISFAGIRKGPKQVSGFFEGIAKDHTNPDLEMTEFVASGDSVAAFGRYKATLKATGKRVDSPVAHLFQFRGGKVVRCINYTNTAAFVAAAAPAGVAPAASAPQRAPTLGGAESLLVKFYGHWGPVSAVHTLMFVLLAVGTLKRALWPLYVAVAVFTIWDLLWIGCSPPDRNAQEVLDTSARARTYTSYFVAVYGAALGYFLLRMGSSEQALVFAIFRNSGVPPVLLLVPFVLPAIAMLFFPFVWAAAMAAI